jgi:SAM-dependent methyltransferase
VGDTMTDDEIRALVAAEEAAGGPWRNRVWFNDRVHAGPESPRAEARSRELFAACRALVPGLGPGVDVLDLGALNGVLYAPFAAAGCRVIAVDCREGNCRKMRLLNRARDWDIEVVRTDVRGWSSWPAGGVILCCGLLYHLEVEDAVALLHALVEARPRLLVLDSMYASSPEMSRLVHGSTWHYEPVREPGTTVEERLGVADASAGNAEGHRLVAAEVVRFLAGHFRPVFQHAIVWEQLPPAAGRCDDPRFRKLLFCVGGG